VASEAGKSRLSLVDSSIYVSAVRLTCVQSVARGSCEYRICDGPWEPLCRLRRQQSRWYSLQIVLQLKRKARDPMAMPPTVCRLALGWRSVLLACSGQPR